MGHADLPERKALDLHLGLRPSVQGVQFFSGYLGGLRDARLATNRVCETGEKLGGRCHGSWLGAIGYLVLLDQIGKCFKPRNKPSLPDGTAIHQALSHFSELSSVEIDALYALRNAFAHDYGLYNSPTSEKQKIRYMHRFKVCEGDTEPVVRLPKTPWNGDYANSNASMTTVVNLEAFGDLVEDICNQIVTLAKAGELEIILPGGSAELLGRYFYYSQVNEPQANF